MSMICMPPAVCGPAGPDLSLKGIIAGLGLTTNLKLCLDAGDANSYNPGVQTAKWLDTSGNGYDFYRGTSGAGDGAEPTFNGSAGGLSSAEYFSFDGGDYFSYDSANEAWMNVLHNDGTVWSVFCVFYAADTTADKYMFSTGASVGSTGVESGTMVKVLSTNALSFFCVNTSGTTGGTSVASTVCTANTWGVLGWGLTENGGAGASSYIEKDGTGTWNAANSRVNANTPGAATIGAMSDKSGPFASGSRLACLAIWQGTALTATNLSDIYNAIKGRFGL